MAQIPKQREAFREMWEHVVRPALKRVNELIDDEPPDHLLHFTGEEGLRGIIKSKSLYMLRAQSSRDPEELEHGSNLARIDILRRSDRGLLDIFNEVLLTFEGRLSDGAEWSKFDPHICCFTVESNIRQQEHWGVYGSKGTGFALRFRGEGLIDGPGLRLAERANGSLAKVMYKLSDQEARTTWLVDFAKEKGEEAWIYARDHFGKWQEAYYLRTGQAMGRIIFAHAATMKRGRFQGENEWRLVHLGAGKKPDGKRAGRTYFEFPFHPDDLEAVMIGPAQNPANAVEVERLLRQQGFEKTRVEIAPIELRLAS